MKTKQTNMIDLLVRLGEEWYWSPVSSTLVLGESIVSIEVVNGGDLVSYHTTSEYLASKIEQAIKKCPLAGASV